MFNIITMVLITNFIGTVDKVENDLAHIVFAYENAGTFDTHLPIELIPCDISEGDRLYVRKTNETTEIRCTEFSPPTVDIIINPVTNEIHYQIKDIPLE